MDINKIVSREELLALTKKAFDNDEVAEFLCGEKGYAVHGNRDIPLTVPTDFNRIVHGGIYKLYLAERDEKIIAKFRRAIIALNDSPTRIWCAYMACWAQIFNEHSRYPAPFKMADDALINQMRATLRSNEQALRNCKEWMGINYADGLWEYITRIDGNLKGECKVGIL